MNKKYIIKRNNTFKAEQRVSKILLIVSIIALIIAFLLEYSRELGLLLKPVLSCYKIGCCASKHKGFLINVLLGISASSFISWICVYLPVKLKLKNQIREIIYDCYEILIEYEFLLFYIEEYIKPNYIESIEDSLILPLEEEIKQEAIRLKARINELADRYEYGNFYSKSIYEILIIYNDELYTSLDAIIAFIDFIYATVGKDNKGMYSEHGIMRYARISRSIVETLMDFLLSTEGLIEQYKPILPEKDYEDLKKTRSQIRSRTMQIEFMVNSSQNIENTRRRLSIINRLQKRLIEIRDKDEKNGNME